MLHFSSPAPTGPPLNFTVTPRARSMTFSWAPPNVTQRNGVITGYSLSCTPLTAEGDITMQYTQDGTFTLGGFTPFITYNCSIFASNSQGDGPVASMTIPTDEDCKLPFQFANVSSCRYTYIAETWYITFLQLLMLHHRVSCFNIIETVLRWCSSPGSLLLRINRME